MYRQHATRLSRQERRIRDRQMCHERMSGATVRQIAVRHFLSKSHVHRIVADCEILSPRPNFGFELVPLPGGMGYTWRHGPASYPKPRAYKRK
jgi:hypothetical protein